MQDQELANSLGANQRQLEQAIADGDMDAAAGFAAAGHELLGRAFVSANSMRKRLGLPEMSWDAAAGNSTGGAPNESGGTPKGMPSAA